MLLSLAVDDDAQVYINGELVIDDQNGFSSSFIIDVTQYVKTGTNLVAVKVQDSSGGYEWLSARLSSVALPTNDEIANAKVIGNLPFTDEVNTIVATTATNDPTTCINNGNSVWYSYTPNEFTRVLAGGFGSGLYSNGLFVSVWTGTPGALTQISCDSNQTYFDASPGTRYFIMVSGEGGGLLRFTANKALELGVTVDRGSRDRLTGTATIGGTVKCNEPSLGVLLSGSLQQPSGRRTIIRGTFFKSVDCTPPFVTWSSPNIIGRNGISTQSLILPYGSGPASATVSAEGCGTITGTCNRISVTQKVQLKGN